MGMSVRMGRILVSENLTLDGVMQAPGGVDEDTSGGFRRGGWAVPYFDPMMAEPAKAGWIQPRGGCGEVGLRAMTGLPAPEGRRRVLT